MYSACMTRDVGRVSMLSLASQASRSCLMLGGSLRLRDAYSCTALPLVSTILAFELTTLRPFTASDVQSKSLGALRWSKCET